MSENEVLFLRSSKKSSGSSKEDSSTNDDDPWDDTLLIAAYDRAVNLAQEIHLKKKQSNDNLGNSKTKKNENCKWKIGDKCRCKYSEDLKYYEADIIDILGSSGMCLVRYVGYENEEKVPLKNLKPSLGDAVRTKQCEEALNDGNEDMEVETEAPTAGKKSQQNQKFSNKKKNEPKNTKNGFSGISPFEQFNFPFPPIGNAIIPPPPPPHIFNSNIGEDDNETEAMSAMLISWYMSGYHTGFYQGLKMAKKQ